MRNLSSRTSVYNNTSELKSRLKLYPYRPVVNQLAKYFTLNGAYIGEDQNDTGNGPVLAHDSIVTSTGRIIRVVSQAALRGTSSNFSFNVYLSPGSFTTETYLHSFTPAPKAWFRPSLAIANDGVTIYLSYVNTSGTVTIKKSVNNASTWTQVDTVSMPATINGTSGAVAMTEAGCTNTTYGQILVLSYEDPYAKIYKYGWSTIHTLSKLDKYYSPRYAQWFDAEALGDGYIQMVSVSANGSSQAQTFRNGVYSDPMMIYGIDPDYPDHQCLISSLTQYGDRLYATLIRKVASGTERLYVNETLLAWTTDGINYAIPENGRISQDATRGKIQIYDDYFYCVSQGNVYKGDFVKSLGNITAAGTEIEAMQHQVSASGDQKTEISATIPYNSVTYPRAHIELYADATGATDQLYASGIVDKYPFSVNPGAATQQVLARGLAGVMNNYYSPIADTFEGQESWYQSLRESDGGQIPYKGAWRFRESSLQWYAPKRREKALGLSLVPVSVSGNWTASVRLSSRGYAFGAGLAFWIELDEDTGEYKDDYLAVIVSNPGTTKIEVIRVTADIVTVLKTITPSISYTAGIFHSLYVSKTSEGINIAFKQSVTGTFSQHLVYYTELGDFREPQKSMVAIAVKPRADILIRSLSDTELTRIYLTSVSDFPNSGVVQIGNERIAYSSKSTSDNSLRILRRGEHGTPISTHSVDDPVYMYNEYALFRGIQLYELRPMLSANDAAKRIITRAGLVYNQKNTIEWDTGDGLPTSVWRATNGHTITSGKVAMNGYMLTTINKSGFDATIVGDILNNGTPSDLGFVIWASDPDVQANCAKTEVFYRYDNGSGTIIMKRNGTVYSVSPWNWAFAPYTDTGQYRTLRILANNEKISLFIDRRLAVQIPMKMGYSPTGYLGVTGANSNLRELVVPELSDPIGSFFWDADDSAASALNKLMEGQSMSIKENPDGSIVASKFRTGRDSLGTWTNDKITQAQKAPDERYWLGGVTVWGKEHWAPMADKYALGTRWIKIEAPYLGTEEECRQEAAYQIALARGQADRREVTGVLDPNAEVFDEVTLEAFGPYLTSGTYVIEAIRTNISPAKWEMQVSLRLKEPIEEKGGSNLGIWGDTTSNYLWGDYPLLWW